jgi:hypothetical protein
MSPFNMILMARGFTVLEKNCYLFPDMSSTKSYSNIPHNRVVQHLLFNKDFAHSVIYTLTLIESYWLLFKDNNESEVHYAQSIW